MMAHPSPELPPQRNPGNICPAGIVAHHASFHKLQIFT
jgi:hypothetical protein